MTGAARRDWPLYLIVAVSLGFALFVPWGADERGATYEFDDASSGWPMTGWGPPERNGDETFMWATGRRAALRLPVEGQRERVIAFRGWPLVLDRAEEQNLTLALNGHHIGILRIPLHPASRSVVAPAHFFNEPGEDNVLILSFSYAHPGDDGVERSMALDWVRVMEVR